MAKLVDLIQRILTRHHDPKTGAPEVILLGHCSNETASEHIARYVFASNLAHGIVLDSAAGSCYGSSILMRNRAIEDAISVDLNRDLLLFGKRVYNATCIQADATHLPFRKQVFDTIVSIETLEHIEGQDEFIGSIKSCLKKRGHLILSTTNKLYTSPFLQKPLNPYHVREYYFEQLLAFLSSHGFNVIGVYGGRKVGRLELIRRIFGSLMKFTLNKFSWKVLRIDELYSIFAVKFRKHNHKKLVDPNPKIFPSVKLKATSNVVLFQYFIVHSVKPPW